MFSIKDIVEKIKHINNFIDNYKKDTVIQSLPSFAYVNRAKKLIEQNNFEKAEAILKEALSLPQEDALVYKYLGLIYEKTMQFDLSVENYQKSAELNPNDKNIWQRLGFVLMSKKEYDRAKRAFENADKVQTGNTDTYTGWGMALMKLKDFSDAREKFSMAIKANKYNFSAVFLCAVMEIRLKMYDKAESKLSFLVKVCPNESNTFEYARLKNLKNFANDAIYYAKKSLEYNQFMLPSYILLGKIYAENLDKENSLKYFEEAENKNLVTSELYLEWGKALEIFEMPLDAKQKLLKAYEIDSNNTEIKSYLGLCYVSLNEYEKAEPLLKEIISNEPDNKVVNQALGIIEYEKKNFDKAIQILRKDDENAINCFYLAKCYETKSDDIKTKDYYEAAIYHNNKYITAYVGYVNYLIEKKDYKEAQRKLRKALKSDENNVDLLNLMFYVSYILVKDNVSEYNVKETIEISKKIENIRPDLFKYPEQRQELEIFLKERDIN